MVIDSRVSDLNNLPSMTFNHMSFLKTQMVRPNGRRVSTGSSFSKHFHMANGGCKQTEKDKFGYNYTGKSHSTLD